MANRKLPFGYKMRRGKICICAQEASLVREIFKAYVEGSSYQQLTHRLNAQGLPYNEQGKPWNKNMVARILNNKIYTGNELYPAILSDEEQSRAISAKPATGTPLKATKVSKIIRRLARCAGCGSPLALSDNRFGWARWNCPSCAALTTDAVTPVIVDELTHILTAIIRDPGIVQGPHQEQDSLSQMKLELSELLRSDEFDEPTAKSKAIALTTAQFDALDSKDYETMRIRYILEKVEQPDGSNIELLPQITSAILIHPTGSVSLKLKNEQILERSDLI